MLLEVSSIAIAYGTAQVLHGVSLTVATGETVTLIGANGAGKTSCLRAISGLEPLTAGSIQFEGERIDALSPRQRLERRGVAGDDRGALEEVVERQARGEARRAAGGQHVVGAGDVVAQQHDDIRVQRIGALDDRLNMRQRHPGIAGMDVGDGGNPKLETGRPLRRLDIV